MLELGATFGPLIAGDEGALLFEVWMGDPGPVPADKEGYYALLKERGIVRLPNPVFTKPATAPRTPTTARTSTPEIRRDLDVWEPARGSVDRIA